MIISKETDPALYKLYEKWMPLAEKLMSEIDEVDFRLNWVILSEIVAKYILFIKECAPTEEDRNNVLRHFVANLQFQILQEEK